MNPTEKTSSAPLLDSIEQEFKVAARAERNEKLEALGALAARCTETLDVREGNIILTALFGALSALLLFAGFKTATIGLAAGGLLLLGAAAYIVLRSKSPLLSLGEEGVLIGTTARGRLPWTAIRDYAVTAHYTNGVQTSVFLVIDLSQDFEPPVFSGGRRMGYLKKSHKISVHMFGVRGMSSDRFSEAFGNYWQSGLARAELAGYDRSGQR